MSTSLASGKTSGRHSRELSRSLWGGFLKEELSHSGVAALGARTRRCRETGLLVFSRVSYN